jgi:hypothetical protein
MNTVCSPVSNKDLFIVKELRKDIFRMMHLAIPDVYSHYVGSQTFILNKFSLDTAPNTEFLFQTHCRWFGK